MDKPQILFHLPSRGLLFLIKENENVVGTAGVILFNNSEGLIKRFYLHKNLRGTGLAAQLLDKLIEKAKSLGVKKLLLDVTKNNLRFVLTQKLSICVMLLI